MSQTITVNASTSVVLIDTSQIINAVVMLPGLDPGHTVTVRDSIGYLSTPNQIVVSTMAGVRFADGTSSIKILNAFGYLTMTSRDVTTWNLVNSFGFPQNRSIASVSSLTASSITAASLYASTSISTSLVTASSGTFGTLSCTGQGQFSSLVIGPGAPLPGINLTVYGSVDISGPLTVGGGLTVSGPMKTGSVSTGAITGTSLAIQGGVSIGGNVSAPTSAFTAKTVTTSSLATAQLSTTSIITGSITSAGTTTTQQLTTSSMTISNGLQIQGLTITPVQSTLVFSVPLTIPALNTDYLTVNNTITTSNLTVNQSILAPNLTLFQLSSTRILNPTGSLSISSVQANNISSASMVANIITSQNLAASTIAISGNLIQPAVGYITLNTAMINSLSTQTLYGGTIQATTFAVNNISVQNLDITGSFSGSTLTSLYIPNAAVTSASISASSITTAALTASTINLGSGTIRTGSTLTVNASTVNMKGISTNTFQTGALSASTLTATHITLGAPVNSTLRGPYFVCTGSTNCVITGGPGDYYTPLYLSNVKPADYVPGTSYTVSATFQYIIPTTSGNLPGNLIYAQNSLFWGNELNTTSFVGTQVYNDIAIYGYYAQDQTSNASIIFQQTNKASNAFNWTATMVNDSETTLILQSMSNANYSLVDPSVYINMQNGILKWDYALNATTIQNSLNDISTRNLLYYGSLKFISDPRLKQDIQPANLRRCYDIIRDIPLHRYEFIDSYVSSFQVTDRRRLGIMADEYEQFFPKSVTSMPSPLSHLSTIKTVDTQQLDMAHLGATQYLLKEIAELRAAIDKLDVR